MDEERKYCIVFAFLTKWERGLQFDPYCMHFVSETMGCD